nr:retrovirus-related Pol polyprotein from transposon TNT 1-94 [Tanacetum cinerariifolium]
DVIHDTPAHQDRWSREKYILLLNILVARLEANRIFLAYAAYIGFMVYQMDVKSALLNRKLFVEVYVQQPPGFKSSEFPNYVCKLDKAPYGLKQAHRAWDHILKGDIELHFVPNDLQLADIFTKPLAEPSFTRLVAELEVDLTSYMLKMAQISKEPEDTLILPSKGVNTGNIANKSLFETTVQPVSQSKAPTDKSMLRNQWPPANATKILKPSRLAEELRNQPKPADAKK